MIKYVNIINLQNRKHKSRSHHFQLYHPIQLYLTQWIFHLWILFTFLVIAGSESGEGSSFSSYSQTSTDEVLGTAEARGTFACSFPTRWAGSWFQSGVHHSITITSSSISTKGKCLEVDGEKYLVYQPRSNCYRCLVFSEKHANVLQYKETFCIHDRRSLQSICSTISGDANLYAMFRLDAEPIDCPLQGPFTFSYDRGYGECRYPESNLDSCTQTSRLLFNYQACPDVPKTESVEEELQCLAAWKEGSYRYFLGLVQYRHHASSYEDRFRCFAYEVISTNGGGGGGSGQNVGNIRRGELLLSSHHNTHSHQQYPQTLALGRSRPKPYHGVSMIGGSGSGSNNNNGTSPHNLMSTSEIVYRVEQSGDATCNGLSTMEGSRTMFLRKAEKPPTKNCQFPSWVQTHPQWYSLDQSTVYEFAGDRFKVTNYSSEQLVNANGPDSLAMTASCMHIPEDEPGYRATIVLHSRAGCKIGYQCMVLHKRDADILEVQFGEWSRKHEEACPTYFDPNVQPYITLISSTPKRAQCPAIGKFSFNLSPHHQRLPAATSSSFQQDGLCTSNGTLRMGCSSLDSLHLEISSHCHDHNHHQTSTPSSNEVTDYNCHGWWEEEGITYMVATLSSSSTKPKRHCFVLRDPSFFSTDDSPQWMRLKQSQEGQMSLFRHSNSDDDDDGNGAATGQQRLYGGRRSFGNSRQMFEDTPTAAASQQASSSFAAPLFFNGKNNNNHVAVGKILEISTFADSCRRNVVVGRQGDFAFNATKIGHCLASSSSPSVIIRAGSSESSRGGGRMSMVMVITKGMMTSVTTGMPQFGIEALCWILLPITVLLAR